jgi:hypothetical protein
MAPPLACIPVCLTLLALGLAGVVIVLAGAYHDPAAEPHPAPQPAAESGLGPAVWRAVALVLCLLLLSIVVLGLYLEG